MIVLLAAGVGVSVLGLLAIGFGIPISDSSFGNALLIAGVVILCTGFILTGMWFVGRELAGIAKLLAQGARATQPDALSIRPSSGASLVPPASEPTFAPVPATPRDEAADQSASPPWADEAAARAKGRVVAPEIPPAAVEPVDAPSQPSPAAPDRPARRNLLFATRRRDKPEQSTEPPLLKPALEAEPHMSFDNAWPTSSKPANGKDAPAGSPPDAAAQPAKTEQAAAPAADVTVLKSGVVDGMAYTLYSDGSIEAQMAGEGLVRFASLDALRTYLDQRQ